MFIFLNAKIRCVCIKFFFFLLNKKIFSIFIQVTNLSLIQNAQRKNTSYSIIAWSKLSSLLTPSAGDLVIQILRSWTWVISNSTVYSFFKIGCWKFDKNSNQLRNSNLHAGIEKLDLQGIRGPCEKTYHWRQNALSRILWAIVWHRGRFWNNAHECDISWWWCCVVDFVNQQIVSSIIFIVWMGYTNITHIRGPTWIILSEFRFPYFWFSNKIIFPLL